MTILSYIKTVNQNIWRSKFRSLLTILSIVIGAATLAVIFVASNGLSTWIDNQIEGINDNGIFYVTKESVEVVEASLSDVREFKEGAQSESITQSEIERISRIQGVNRVETPINTELRYKYSIVDNKKKISSGLEAVYSQTELSLYAGKMIDEQDTTSVIASFEVLKAMGYEDPKDAIGRDMSLVFENQLTGEDYTQNLTVVGVLENSIAYNSQNYVSQTKVEQIYNDTVNPDLVSNEYFAVLAFHDPQLSTKDTEDLFLRIEEEGFNTETTASVGGEIRDVINSLTGGLSVVAAIALVAAFFGVSNALYTATLERTKEIGLLSALGMSKKSIFFQFAIEAWLIGLWGSIIGVIVGVAGAFFANRYTATEQVFGFESGNAFSLSPGNALIVVIIVTTVTLIAGVIPAIRAARKDTVEALRYE